MSTAALARKVARLLQKRGVKLVLAESCTGGLVCGALTRVPGISSYLCGGMVTYRNETKTQYLGIAARLLKNPGPVSEVVARHMAEQVLARTPEASVAASVTGHLGPGAPPELDGVVFLGVANRVNSRKAQSTVRRYVCTSSLRRLPRQREVVDTVLALIAEILMAEATDYA